MKKSILAGVVMLGLAAAPLFAADDAWVTKVAKDGMAEVELGNLAATKASADNVKQFAQRMVSDHSKANDELKALAASKKITLPAEVDPQAKALHTRLSNMSGMAFDQAYMKAMVDDHVKAVNAFKIESKSGTDAELKAWAAKTLPTLEEHLRMARETNGAVGTAGRK